MTEQNYKEYIFGRFGVPPEDISKFHDLDITDEQFCDYLKNIIFDGHNYNVSLDEIKRWVEIKHGNVNSVDKNGYSLLMLLFGERHEVKSIEYLLEKGADVNYQDKYGNTIFHDMYDDYEYSKSFTDNGDKSIWKKCIENGADLNIKNKDGKTALEKIVDEALDLLKTNIIWNNHYELNEDALQCIKFLKENGAKK